MLLWTFIFFIVLLYEKYLIVVLICIPQMTDIH